MSTTVQTPPQPPAPAGPPRTPSGAGRVIAILAIALGVLIVVGAAFSAVTSTIASALVRTESRTVATAGVTDLDVDLSAGSLTVVFVDDTQDATLEVTSSYGVSEWTLERDGSTLTVASPDRRFGPSLWFGNVGRAVLRLDADLQEGLLNGDLRVSAGDLTVAGSFRSLDIELGAGRATVSGAAERLAVDVSAGAADLELGNVEQADLKVSAGAVTARFTGTQPRSVTADVSAGSVELRVPEGQYDVRSSVTAGEFDNAIDSLPGAESSIDVQVSAGRVALSTR